MTRAKRTPAKAVTETKASAAPSGQGKDAPVQDLDSASTGESKPALKPDASEGSAAAIPPIINENSSKPGPDSAAGAEQLGSGETSEEPSDGLIEFIVNREQLDHDNWSYTYGESVRMTLEQAEPLLKRRAVLFADA